MPDTGAVVDAPLFRFIPGGVATEKAGARAGDMPAIRVVANRPQTWAASPTSTWEPATRATEALPVGHVRRHRVVLVAAVAVAAAVAGVAFVALRRRRA